MSIRTLGVGTVALPQLWAFCQAQDLDTFLEPSPQQPVSVPALLPLRHLKLGLLSFPVLYLWP